MRRRGIAVAAGAIAGFLLLLAVGGFVLISTGAYNVAATARHTPFARWLLNTTQERSVAVRADEVPPRPPVDSAMLRIGFEEYHEMCVACHGAPGVERGPLGKGINPEPPDLAEEAAEWSDRELFWITKHGIKMAGMPAFGITHSDEELWAIVAFLRRLRSMAPEEYRRLATEAETGAQMHEHAGMLETAPRGPAGMQGALRGTDHSHAEQPRTAGASVPSVQEHRGHRGTPGVGRGGMPGRQGTAGRPAAEPLQVDAGTTEKLTTLAAELLRDSVVAARVRADSTLRRRWENDIVRRQLARPPR